MDDLKNEKGRFFDAVNIDGNTIQCEIVMTYFCDKNNKVYIIYTNNTKDNDGNLNLYASEYLGEKDGNPILKDIKTDEEWLLFDKILEEARGGLNG